MESKKERLKKLIAESEKMVARMDEVVKNIKPGDTSKIVLTSAPFAAKKETTTLVK